MPLIENIRSSVAALFAAKPVVIPQSDVQTASYIASILRDHIFGLEPGREARYNDFNTMDQDDMAAVLDVLTDQTVHFEEAIEATDDVLEVANCFKIDTIKGNEFSRNIIRNLLESTDLRGILPQMCRDLIKYGDEFCEVVWDDDTIVGIQPIPVHQMRVNKDSKGNFSTKKDDQGRPTAYQQFIGTKIIAGFEPFEIIHFKLQPSKKATYSTKSFLDDYRNIWKKLTWLEEGMVLARVTRAYPRIVWTRDITGKTKQEAQELMRNFIQAITTKKQGENTKNYAPMQPDEDYFQSTGYITGEDGKQYERKDDIKLLDPNLTGLSNITDVAYMRRKLFSRVPSSVIGINDAGQGDMTAQDIAMSRYVQHIQDMLECGIRTLVDRAIFAKSGKLTYRVVWPRTLVHTDWRYADAAFRESMAMQNYRAQGVLSTGTIRKRVFGYTDAESIAEQDKVDAEAQKAVDEQFAKMEAQLKMQAQVATDTATATNSGTGKGKGSGNSGSATKSAQRTAGNNTATKVSTSQKEQLDLLNRIPPPIKEPYLD